MRLQVKNILPFILLLVFAVIPLVLGFTYAILYSLGIIGVVSNGFTFMHWNTVFSDKSVTLSFSYTILLSIVSIVITVMGAAFVVLKMGDKLKKGIGSYIIYLPMAFPSIVAAFFFFQFLSNAGLLSRFFYKIGFIDSIASFPYLVNDQFSVGILAAQFFLSLPVFTVLFISVLLNENVDALKKLGASLGASRPQILYRIVLPVILKKSFPTIVLFFIFKLGSYEIPLLLGRSTPETISVLTVRKLQRFNISDIPQGYAIAIVYAILVFALLAASLRPSKISLNV